MRDYSEFFIRPTVSEKEVNPVDLPFRISNYTGAFIVCFMCGIIAIGCFDIKANTTGIIFSLPSIIFILFIFNGMMKNNSFILRYKEDQIQKAKEDAIQLSQKLRDLIIKSEELANVGLHKLIETSEIRLKKIEFEFNDDALIPFWDEVENFIKDFDQYHDSLRILKENARIYYQYVHTTNNNFPKVFPIGTSYSYPKDILLRFEQVKRQAFKKFEFANLWEQRKTQKILVLGFNTLAEAINNMSYSITNAVNELTDVVQTGFESIASEIRKTRIQQHRNHLTSSAELDSRLLAIDEKLNYIQYKRIPSKPFRL